MGSVADTGINLAIEEYLMATCKENEAILFLWQSDNTVVIGRHQNPYKECNLPLMKEENVKLIRRKSGGGAVYHDSGNLNFSFILRKEYYSLDKQFSVILNGLKKLNLHGQVNGRNDMVIDGCKFSGNAFIHQKDVSCHHGTLLIESELSKLGKFLTPSQLKLKAKGVDSVKSRVANLKSHKQDLTIQRVKDAIIEAFFETYKGKQTYQSLPNRKLIESYEESYRQWDWNYGKTPKYDLSFGERFDWGTMEIDLSLNSGKIEACAFNTDCLEDEPFKLLEEALCGCRFTETDISACINRFLRNERISQDVVKLIAGFI